MIKVGVIGAGLIGKKRIESIISANNGSEVVAICDVDIGKAKGLGDKYRIGSYQNWMQLIKSNNIDTVVVSTPNKYLKEISLGALENNKNILCEKPLGRNAKDAEEICLKAEEKKKIIKTGFNHRHHPAVFQAKQIIESGEFGRIYFIRCIYGHGGRPGYEKEWRASKDLCGGGELLDQGVHVVDLFRWFMGEFEVVYGQINTFYWNIEVEDNSFAVFKTHKGQIAVMHTSWTQWKNKFLFEVFGEKGYLIVDGLGGSYGTERLVVGKRISDVGCRMLDVGYQMSESGNRKPENGNRVEYAGGVPEEEVIEFPGPDISWAEEWKEFVSAIKENREPLGSGYDGLMANKMIEAVYRSAKLNKPVKLKDIGC